MSGRRKKLTEATQESAEKPVESQFHSRSEQRRVEAMTKVSITAKTGAKLPDGTFVQKGETVEVSKAFADRLRKEKDGQFIIN